MRSARMTIWMVAMVVVFGFLCEKAGAILFNDGLIHNINYEVTDEQMWIENESFWNDPTTVNIIQGGMTKKISVEEDSILNIDGGIINDTIFIYDNAKMTLNSGTVNGAVRPYDNSYVEINGGTLYDNLFWIQENSHVVINGGNVILDNYISIDDNSTLTINGGVISGYLNAGHTGKINIYGGTFDGPIHFADDTITTIYGSDFYINGKPSPYGSYSGQRSGVITGLLTDGTALNHNLEMYNNATLILAVPEPATLLLLGLGAVILRKRK